MKMNLDTMAAAKREAEKFLALLENAIDEMSDSLKTYPGISPKSSGALRRSSMDLTRKLADLRQNR